MAAGAKGAGESDQSVLTEGVGENGQSSSSGVESMGTRLVNYSRRMCAMLCNKKTLLSAMERIFTPPFIAISIGIVVALVPFLKKLFFLDRQEDGWFPNLPAINPPLRFITEATLILADASMYATLYLLLINRTPCSYNISTQQFL
jgi:hypothetical protein